MSLRYVGCKIPVAVIDRGLGALTVISSLPLFGSRSMEREPPRGKRHLNKIIPCKIPIAVIAQHSVGALTGLIYATSKKDVTESTSSIGQAAHRFEHLFDQSHKKSNKEV